MDRCHLKIAIVAGEASGDLLGAHLIEAIKSRYPNASFYGIGGPLMIQQGFTSYFKQEDLAVRGYIEILKSVVKLLRIRQQITQIILKDRPDVFIGIDSPDFNFAIEKKTYAQKIPTIHYVSPSVWAWKAKRIEKIIQFTDNILCLFPIEPPIYQKYGGNATFVGHPLANKIPLTINQQQSRKQLNLSDTVPLFVIMPGSRVSEINYMTPIFLATAQKLLAQYPNAQFVIPTVSGANKNLIQKIIQQQSLESLPISFIKTQDKHQYIAAANVVLVTSGTATLEVALCKTPMVISYKISPLTYHVVKHFILLPFVGLPNILLNRFIVPELIQDQATAENLYQATLDWMQHPDLRENITKDFMQLHRQLNQDNAKLAADAIFTTIQKQPQRK